MEGALQDGAENYTETPLQLAAAAGASQRSIIAGGVQGTSCDVLGPELTAGRPNSLKRQLIHSSLPITV